LGGQIYKFFYSL